MKHLKKLSEEVIHQNPWWVYKHDTYEKPNGGIGHYYYGQLPGSTIIVPRLSDGRIVMIIQYRYLLEKLSIEFPCGGSRSLETPLQNAQAELREETGCLAETFTHVGSFQPYNGVILDECHVFLAEVVHQERQALDDTEQIDVLYRRPDEIEEMVHRNEIWNGETLAAWAMVGSRVHGHTKR